MDKVLNEFQAAQAGDKKGFLAESKPCMPLDMIAATFSELACMLYEIKNLRTISYQTEDGYSIKLTSDNPNTRYKIRHLLDYMEDMELASKPTLDPDRMTISYESLGEFLDILRNFQNTVHIKNYDVEQAEQNAPPTDELLKTVIENSGYSSIVFDLITGDNFHTSREVLFDEMRKGFHAMAGLHNGSKPVTYSIATLERVVKTHEYPSAKADQNFWYQ